MDAKFCVIGETAFDITWLHTKEAGIEHARNLLKKAKPGTKLLVVKAVVVVKVAEPNPPIEITNLED